MNNQILLETIRTNSIAKLEKEREMINEEMKKFRQTADTKLFKKTKESVYSFGPDHYQIPKFELQPKLDRDGKKPVSRMDTFT